MTPTDATAVPTDLRHRRQTLALSPAALAGALGVHPTSVLRWERRERLPGPAHIRRLAAVLELSTPQVAGFFDAAGAPAPATGFRGHGLRRLRATAGRSAVALAAAAGVPVSTVYNWEAGRSRVPDRHLAPLAGALGLDPAALRDLLRRAPAGRPPLRHHGSPLRRLRSRRGLTQDAAARRVGVSRHTLGGWERGTRPPLHALRRLATTYGVPVGAVAAAAGVPTPRELDPRVAPRGPAVRAARPARVERPDPAGGRRRLRVQRRGGAGLGERSRWSAAREPGPAGGPLSAVAGRAGRPGQPVTPNRQASGSGRSPPGAGWRSGTPVGSASPGRAAAPARCRRPGGERPGSPRACRRGRCRCTPAARAGPPTGSIRIPERGESSPRAAVAARPLGA